MIKDPGKAAEYLFASKCLNYGYMTCQPASEKIGYDLIVDNGSSVFHRVQVKSTYTKDKDADRYSITLKKGFDSRPYTKYDCDLVACYVYEMHTWYIMPISVVEGKTKLGLYPHRKSIGQYEHFKENWNLLKEGK